MLASDDAGTTCVRTGLHVVPASAIRTAYRVALDRGERSPLQGYRNELVGPLPPGAVERRGRFDRDGHTVYFADTPETAFAEVLTAFRRELAKLAPLALSIGTTPDQWAERIIAEAEDNDLDRPWAISGDWQWQRSIYEVQLPADGWWVQIDHPDTLAVLNRALAGHLPAFGIDIDGVLTSGHLEGEDRAVTTVVSTYIARLALHGGDEPLGILYRSKSLVGRCCAFFDRRADDGLAPGRNDPRLLGSTNVDTPAFRAVAEKFGLPVLPGRRR
ncbi:RES domain-containing protein [Isoptericola sp. NPDC057191]|uniref:RES domain-containing protein n=1 Tax=Isoptericola sp. NPDC057191 TaxID=3346041 RepID=UPI00363A625A